MMNDVDLDGLLTTVGTSRCFQLQVGENDDETPALTGTVNPATVTLWVVLSAVIVGTVVGNSCVILSVIMFDKMRTMSNGLIASLASADLLVAVVVMPLSLQVRLHQVHDQLLLGTMNLPHFTPLFVFTSSRYQIIF